MLQQNLDTKHKSMQRYIVFLFDYNTRIPTAYGMGVL